MNLFVVAVLCLMICCTTNGVEGFWGIGRDNMRPPRPPPPPASALTFPACEEFVNAVMRQVRRNQRNGEGGPMNCRGADPEGLFSWMCRAPGFRAFRFLSPRCRALQDECQFEDMINARNQISEEPSSECRNQINQFLDGNITSTGSSSTPQITTSTGSSSTSQITTTQATTVPVSTTEQISTT